MGASIRKAFELLKHCTEEYPLCTFTVSTDTAECLSSSVGGGDQLQVKKVSCVHISLSNI